MRVSLYGVKLENMDWKVLFEVWHNMKNQRIFCLDQLYKFKMLSFEMDLLKLIIKWKCKMKTNLSPKTNWRAHQITTLGILILCFFIIINLPQDILRLPFKSTYEMWAMTHIKQCGSFFSFSLLQLKYIWVTYFYTILWKFPINF